MRFGALLASGEGGGAFAGAISACAGAMDSGADAFLYLLHEGVRKVHDPGLQALRDRGLRLFCCAFGARRREMEADEAAVYCGLGTLADIIASADRFSGYTGSPWDGQAGGVDASASRRRVQIRVSSDPESSDRVAEGVRVAAGLLASGRLEAALVFSGLACRCLKAGAETLRDGPDMVMYLRSFRDGGGDVRVEGGTDGGGAGLSGESEGYFATLGF